MNNYLALIVGVFCAGIGGELFVRGVVGIARWARVSAGIIGATVAAFATSSPELSVAITAAMAGKPQISLGDALGSNVVNVALVLAVTLLISGIQCPRDSVKRDFPIALITPVVIGVLALDGVLSRLDGLLLLGMFIAWAVAVTVEARKQRSAAGEILGEQRRWLAIILCLAGLVFLIVAGRFIVTGAKGIAISFGIGEFVIGATVVAIGTSVPELATTVVSKIRRHDEVGLGTILGSNIFNGLFVVAIAAIIFPISIDWREVAIALVFGIVTVVLIWPARGGHIERRRGVLLLALYIVYVVTFLRL
ncbi:MAG: calcium/sodium antiporter [Sulfuricaulis sp.]|nr:calcium/sodium antiporter [Sulfuricaulis sp.]